MDKVVAADPEAVAVAAGHRHRELVIGEFDARGHGQGAAVKRVHAVRAHVARQVRRTADAADRHYVMGLDLQIHQRLLECGENAKIAAPGAPIRIYLPFEIGQGYLLKQRHCCRHDCSS